MAKSPAVTFFFDSSLDILIPDSEKFANLPFELEFCYAIRNITNMHELFTHLKF